MTGWQEETVAAPAHAYPGPTVEPPPPVYGAVIPYDQPLPPHGGYLVTHPDRLESERSLPKVWPVAVFTLLFSVLGAVSASRRANRAKAAGGAAAPYWLTFGIVAVAGFVLSGVVTVAVAIPAYLAVREEAAVTALQENLVTDGRLAAEAKLKATAARCDAEGERGDDDRRPYVCVLTLSTKRTGTLHVTADSAGVWAMAPTP